MKTLEQLSLKDLEALVELKKPDNWVGIDRAYQVRNIAEVLGSQKFNISNLDNTSIAFKFENKELVLEYLKTNRWISSYRQHRNKCK